MSLIGALCCTMLIITSLSLNDSVNYFVGKYYEGTLRYSAVSYTHLDVYKRQEHAGIRRGHPVDVFALGHAADRDRNGVRVAGQPELYPIARLGSQGFRQLARQQYTIGRQRYPRFVLSLIHI